MPMPTRLRRKAFDERLHPRGQPENAGQFGSGGGSSKEESGKQEFHPTKIPHDLTGDVDLVDSATGEILTSGPAAEIRKMVADSIADGDPLTGLVARPAKAEVLTAQKEAAAKARDEHDRKAKELQARSASDEYREGGKHWKPMPERVYHATFAGDKIASDGFKTADELGGAADVLGGSNRAAVSFTTKENAEAYRDGLEVAWKAARGDLNPDDTASMFEIGAQFGVDAPSMKKILPRFEGEKDKPKRLFGILQQVSFKGKKFPLFMGSDWTGTVKNSKTPPSIVSASSSGLKDVVYAPSETEWKVHDARSIDSGSIQHHDATSGTSRLRRKSAAPAPEGMKAMTRLRFKSAAAPSHADATDEDPNELAALIADILGGIYGDDALDLIDRLDEGEGDTSSAAKSWPGKAWDEVQHPRGHGGRFIPKHSAEARTAAHEEVGKALKQPASPEGVKSLVEHLSILTVKQLQALKKEHGLSASGKLKADLVAKLADRLSRGRSEGANEEGAKEPAAPTVEKVKDNTWGTLYRAGGKDFATEAEAKEYVKDLTEDRGPANPAAWLAFSGEERDRWARRNVPGWLSMGLPGHRQWMNQATGTAMANKPKEAEKDTSAEDAKAEASAAAHRAKIKPVTDAFEAHLRDELKAAGMGDLAKKVKPHQGGAMLPKNAPEKAVSLRNALVSRYGTVASKAGRGEDVTADLAALRKGEAPKEGPTTGKPSLSTLRDKLHAILDTPGKHTIASVAASAGISEQAAAAVLNNTFPFDRIKDNRGDYTGEFRNKLRGNSLKEALQRRLREMGLRDESPGEQKSFSRLRFKTAPVQTKSILAPVPCCAACGHGDCCETPAAQDALAVLDHRGESVPAGFSYKFAPSAFALDSPVMGEHRFSDKDMAITYVFAAAQGRDRDGDYMEIGPTANGEGILTANHERNAVAYVEHGQKFFPLPIGYDRVRVGDAFTGPYTVVLDPERGLATCTTYLTQSRPEGEQVYHMYREGLLRGGSIGYRPIKSVRLAPAPADGHFTDAKKGHAGLHLLTVELLETTLTGMPMNADAVRRSIEMGCCGRPLAPGLKSMLVAKAGAAPIWSDSGWEGKASDWAKDPSHHAADSGRFTAGGGASGEHGTGHSQKKPEGTGKPSVGTTVPHVERMRQFAAATFKVGKPTSDPNVRILTRRQVENALAKLHQEHGHFLSLPGVDRGEASTEYTGLPISVTRTADGRYLAHRGLGREESASTPETPLEPEKPAVKVEPGKHVTWEIEAGGRTHVMEGIVREVKEDGTATVFSGSGSRRVPVDQLKPSGKSGVPFGSQGLNLLREIADDPSHKKTPVGKVAWNLVDEIDRNNVKMDAGTEKFIREGSPDQVYAMLRDVAAQGQSHNGGEVRRAATEWVASHVKSASPLTKSADLTTATVPTTAPEPPHAFSSTHFAIPEPHASRVRQLAAAIPDADLAEDGRSLVPHITARFGLHTGDVSEVIEAVRGCGPILVTLGATSIFAASEKAPYDVVKIDVESYPLRRLHRLLGKRLANTRTHPRYFPHCTIAYLQPGKGAAYTGASPLTGATMLLDRLIFSDREGTQTEIALTGVGSKRSLTDMGVAVKSFDERLHPRGQPENAGQFGSGGGATRDSGDGHKQSSGRRMTFKEAGVWAGSAFAGWAKSLPAEEATALRDFQNLATEANYKINEHLRKPGSNPAGEKLYAKLGPAIDRAIERGVIPEDVIAYRGIGPRSSVVTDFDGGKIKPGDTFSDPAYGYSTMSEVTAGRYVEGEDSGGDPGEAGILTEVRLPKGTHAAYMDAVPGMEDQERAFLLPRGSKYKVLKVEKTGGKRKLILELLPSEGMVGKGTKSFDERLHPRGHEGNPGQFASGGSSASEESQEPSTPRSSKETAAKKRVAEDYAALNSKDAAAYKEWEEKLQQGGLRAAGPQPKSSSAEYVRLFRDLPGDAVESVDPAHDEMFAKHLEGDTWLLYDDGMVTRRSEHSLRIILGGEIKGHDAPNHALTQKRIDTSRRLANDFPTTREGAAALELTSDLELVPAGSSRKNLKLLGTRAAEALWEGLPHELAKPRTINGEKVWVKRINDAFAVISDGTNQKIASSKKARVGGGPDRLSKIDTEDEDTKSTTALTKAIAHAPAGSPQGGQFTSGSSGSSGTAKPAAHAPPAAASAAPSPQTVLAGLPKTAGHLARAKHALHIAKEKALEKLQRLSALIISADAIPIASDFAREALLKGAGQSNALHGVPLQDVANIATRALAWAWTKVKAGMGTGAVKVKSLEHDDTDTPDAADAVLEIIALLHEMMGLPDDTPLPGRDEVEKALAAKGKSNGTSRLRRKTIDPDARAKAAAERLYGQLEARYGQKTAAQIVAAASETPVDSDGAAAGLAHVCAKVFGDAAAGKVYTRLRFKTRDAHGHEHDPKDGRFTSGHGGSATPKVKIASIAGRFSEEARETIRSAAASVLPQFTPEKELRFYPAREGDGSGLVNHDRIMLSADDLQNPQVVRHEIHHAWLEEHPELIESFRALGTKEVFTHSPDAAEEGMIAAIDALLTGDWDEFGARDRPKIEAWFKQQGLWGDASADGAIKTARLRFKTWRSEDHPRGHEGNPGQFASAGGSATTKRPKLTPSPFAKLEAASAGTVPPSPTFSESPFARIPRREGPPSRLPPVKLEKPKDFHDTPKKEGGKPSEMAAPKRNPSVLTGGTGNASISGEGGGSASDVADTAGRDSATRGGGAAGGTGAVGRGPSDRSGERHPDTTPGVKPPLPTDARTLKDLHGVTAHTDLTPEDVWARAVLLASKDRDSVRHEHLSRAAAQIQGEKPKKNAPITNPEGEEFKARGGGLIGLEGQPLRYGDLVVIEEPDRPAIIAPVAHAWSDASPDATGFSSGARVTIKPSVSRSREFGKPPSEVSMGFVRRATQADVDAHQKDKTKKETSPDPKEAKSTKEPHEMTRAEYLADFQSQLSPGDKRRAGTAQKKIEKAEKELADLRQRFDDTSRLKQTASSGEARNLAYQQDRLSSEMERRRAAIRGARADLGRVGSGEMLHRSGVEMALADGKPVPPEVLADYPDLVAKGKSPTAWPAKSAAPLPDPDPLTAFREQGLALGAAIRAALERSAAP